MVIASPAGVHDFFHHYGYVGIFCLFALGIIGLPVPDETLLIILGFSVAKAYLPMVSTVVAVYTGAICGITVSYLIGYFGGRQFLLRFGSYFRLSPERLEKAHLWFERRGKWTLLLGYYVPGVRHVFGIIAGSAYLSYTRFALFAYLGALIWSSTFLSIGYFFYLEWSRYLPWLH